MRTEQGTISYFRNSYNHRFDLINSKANLETVPLCPLKSGACLLFDDCKGVAYMNKDEFIGPPTIWVVLTVVGGIATALGLIVTLEYASKRLSPKTSLNTQSFLAIVSGIYREMI